MDDMAYFRPCPAKVVQACPRLKKISPIRHGSGGVITEQIDALPNVTKPLGSMPRETRAA